MTIYHSHIKKTTGELLTTTRCRGSPVDQVAFGGYVDPFAVKELQMSKAGTVELS